MLSRTSVVVFVSAVAMVASHMRLDKLVGPHEEQRRAAIAIPGSTVVRLVDGGFDKLVADLYWLEFVQYCGVNNERGKSYARSYDFVKLITDLDPRFIKPYWFGCWAIGYWQKAPDKADEILKTAIDRNPNVWELPYLAGINAYIFAKNAQAAARYYRLAAKDPGADPVFLNRQADTLASDMPELFKKRRTIQGLYERTKDINLKGSLYRELMGLLDVIEQQAPNEMIKQSVERQKKDLETDYTKTLEQS
jgi:tetratricopeptide (TPR) repeat protein